MKDKKGTNVALQLIWMKIIDNYNDNYNLEMRMGIVQDLINNLVDIDDGKNALYSKYIKWEETVWDELCDERLEKWKKNNPLYVDTNRVDSELQQIRLEENPKRFHKILQLIQDSDYGLDKVGVSGGGHYVGPKDVERFTG